ncbi:lytic transglycosylase domain-containing protein [Clostridium diolis]|uniref:Transglycosylase n=1 Tax=Clostridium diolis TaxID=223919 RepID=A0AAV3W5B1_9CLOT|nr:lytic transglycosylase domain-containing protein [Clostridium diolis]QES71641.1 lytic transglycosylase domain-containing protein [Clostridium diolis]GEA33650.1 transglycosylase [Clostridium diolis]
MAIDGLDKMSNEQLLAMNMLSNGQVTNDSDSDSSNSTSGEKDLAFQLVMKNLLESSKKSKENGNAESNGNTKEVKSETTNSEKVNSKENINLNNAARVGQTYVTGQNLEEIPMVLTNNYIGFTRNSESALSNKSGADIKKIYSAVDDAAKKYGVDPNLILAVIKQESDFDPNSTSGVGATGLMQIMPENFSHLGITDGYDVEQNVSGGTKLLKEYLDKYNGSSELALMAYNGGPGTMQRRGVSSASDLYKMPQETQNYVPKVMGYYRNGI